MTTLGAPVVAGVLLLASCAEGDSEATGAQTLRGAPAPATEPTADPTAAESAAEGASDASGDQPAASAPNPVLVRVPEVGIETGLVPLGILDDGTLETPDFGIGGWWQGGPECGPEEAGRPCVLAGHVGRTASGEVVPDVFYPLIDTPIGAEIIVERADGSEVVYEATRVEQHPKDAFPTDDVYGETPGTTIRLVTCGGELGPDRRHRDNIILYGELKAEA